MHAIPGLNVDLFFLYHFTAKVPSTDQQLDSVIEEDGDESLLRKRFLSASSSKDVWNSDLSKQKVTRRHSSPGWVR